MSDLLPALTGFSIQVSSILANGKKAILMGRTVYVSPAMHALMDGASSDELERLLSKIEIIHLPEPLGMFTIS